MKRYIKEIIILFLQLFMFHIFPNFAGPTDAMGMVFLIIFATLALSFILGVASDNKIKFFYPPVIAVLFIPSIFLYYNESASIHAVWYLVISSIGLLMGSVINIVLCKISKKK